MIDITRMNLFHDTLLTSVYPNGNVTEKKISFHEQQYIGQYSTIQCLFIIILCRLIHVLIKVSSSFHIFTKPSAVQCQYYNMHDKIIHIRRKPGSNILNRIITFSDRHIQPYVIYSHLLFDIILGY